MPLCRASELPRLLVCAGSGWLPRVLDTLVSESRLESRAWGNYVHKWVETGEVVNPLATDKYADLLLRKLQQSGTVHGEWWPPGQNEIAVAYNVETGQSKAYTSFVEQFGASPHMTADEWKASFGDEWITGTADYYGEIMDEPWLDDLKTGRLVTFEDYKAQQLFYAAVLGCLEYGRPVETRSTLTHWPKYPIAGRPSRFGETFSAQEQTEFLFDLKALRYHILARDESVLNPTEKHCRFCPSRQSCRAAYTIEGN